MRIFTLFIAPIVILRIDTDHNPATIKLMSILQSCFGSDSVTGSFVLRRHAPGQRARVIVGPSTPLWHHGYQWHADGSRL